MNNSNQYAQNRKCKEYEIKIHKANQTIKTVLSTLKIKSSPEFSNLTWKILGDLIKTNSALSHYYIIPGTGHKEEKKIYGPIHSPSITFVE